MEVVFKSNTALKNKTNTVEEEKKGRPGFYYVSWVSFENRGKNRAEDWF